MDYFIDKVLQLSHNVREIEREREIEAMKIERTGLYNATVEIEGVVFDARLENKSNRIVAVVAIDWHVANAKAGKPLGITKDFEVKTDFDVADFEKQTWAARSVVVDDAEYADEMRFASKQYLKLEKKSVSPQFDENDIEQLAR